MSGPIGRLIATVIIATAQLGTRVVVDAWRQAAAKGAQQAARGGQAAQEAAVSRGTRRRRETERDHTCSFIHSGISLRKRQSFL